MGLANGKFLKAAKEGRMTALQQALASGANINTVDKVQLGQIYISFSCMVNIYNMWP